MSNSNKNNVTRNDYTPVLKTAMGGGDFGRSQADTLRQQIISRYTDPSRGMSVTPRGTTYPSIGGSYNPVEAGGPTVQGGTSQGGADFSLKGSSNPNPGAELSSSTGDGWFNLPGGGYQGDSYLGSGASYLSGIGSPDFGAAKAGYQKFADTGGINRGDWADAQAGYKDFAGGGGVDARALRERATAQIPAFYQNFKQSAQRRANVQGGYSPGFDAQQAEMARQAGREGFQASRQVEGDIADKVQAGREFGIAGQGNLATTIAGMEQSGKLSGLGGLTSIAGQEGSLGLQRAGLASGIDYNRANLAESARRGDMGAQLQLQQMWQQGGQQQNAGLMDLYRSAPGDVGQNMNTYLQGLGGIGGNLQDNRSWWDKYGRYVTGAAGAVGGAFVGGPAGAMAGYGLGSRLGPQENQPNGQGDYYANSGGANA